MSSVAAFITLVILAVLTPAAAAPLIPAVKNAQCPFGYMQLIEVFAASPHVQVAKSAVPVLSTR